MVVNLVLLCKVAGACNRVACGDLLRTHLERSAGSLMALKVPESPLVVLQGALDRAGGLNAAQGELIPSEVADNGWKFQALGDME